MSQTFRIRKGVDIRLKGEASKTYETPAKSDIYAIKPTDFHGLVPKLTVKVGDEVKAGTPLFHDKYNSKIQYVSPVSGEIADVVRGEKRKILEVRILPDSAITYQPYQPIPGSASREDAILALTSSGMWPFIRQRPFDIVANPDDKPKAIFISGFDSSPLGPDADFIMEGLESDFQAGVEVLQKLADGNPIFVGARKGSAFYNNVSGITVNYFSGPHPAGNVGVQIHQVSPINKGEVVWHLNPQDVANIGRFAETGKVDLRRSLALTGSHMNQRHYLKTTLGASIKSLIGGKYSTDNTRLISGNVLTGEKVSEENFLGFYHHQITAIPEGDDPQFFLTEGWLAPGFGKFSLSHSFPTWLLPKSKKWDLDTNMNGEERAFVMTGEYEKVFPFNIYPVQLVKSIIVNDIDSMEKLGIYEIAPEDFALCEYVCTSKIPVQKIVREGLDVVKIECA